MRAVRLLLIATQFLTRLPVSLQVAPANEELGRSVLCYPVVGLMIGALLVGLGRLLPELAGLLPAAILLCVWVLLTGALHLDGLADSADAWAGGLGDGGRTLAIMKDPRSGPVAVATVVLVLLLKFAAMDLAISRHDAFALLLAPTLGRTVPLLLFLTTPYVRPAGIGAVLVQCLPRRSAILVLGGVLTATFAALGLRAIGPLLLAGLVFALLRNMMMSRIGGATGDTIGALIELTECAVLVGMLLV